MPRCCASAATPLLGSVDQTRDTRLVERQQGGQLLDGRLAISQYAEEAGLDDRRVVLAGDPAQRTLHGEAQLGGGVDQTEIVFVTGPSIELPSVALRSANLRLQGVGQGSVSGDAYLAEMPSLVEQIAAGSLPVNAQPVPLAEVGKAWTAPEARGARTVFIP
jgi:hypothetical protein